MHVATWIEAQTRELAAPSVKQRLAALRHLFDWLVVGQVVPTNPAASVRGPQHIDTLARLVRAPPAGGQTHAILVSLGTDPAVGYIEQPLRDLQPGMPPEQLAMLARSLFSAVHGIITLVLEKILGVIPLDTLRMQTTLVVSAIGMGLLAGTQ